MHRKFGARTSPSRLRLRGVGPQVRFCAARASNERQGRRPPSGSQYAPGPGRGCHRAAPGFIVGEAAAHHLYPVRRSRVQWYERRACCCQLHALPALLIFRWFSPRPCRRVIPRLGPDPNPAHRPAGKGGNHPGPVSCQPRLLAHTSKPVVVRDHAPHGCALVCHTCACRVIIALRPSLLFAAGGPQCQRGSTCR